MDLKIEFVVKLSDDTKDFIKSLFVKSEAAAPKAETPKPQAATPKAETPKPQTAAPKAEQPKQTTAPAAAPKAEPPKQTAAPSQDEISIESLRKELSKKVTAHRETIKAKLTSLGASNLTTLDKSHYQTIYKFLESLE